MNLKVVGIATAFACVTASATAQAASAEWDAEIAEWEVGWQVDKLDGKRTLKAIAETRIGRDQVQVVAECHAAALALRFLAFDRSEKALAYRRVGADVDEAVNVRYVFDGNKPSASPWPVRAVNEAGLLFFDHKRKAAFLPWYAKNFGKGTDAENEAGGQYLQGLGSSPFGALFGLDDDSMLGKITAGAADELSMASRLKVELPFMDGRLPVVALDLRAQSWRRFISECAAAAPRAPGRPPPPPGATAPTAPPAASLLRR